MNQILSAVCFSLFVTLTKHGVGHHAEYFVYVRPEWMEVFFKLAWWYAWIVVIAYTTIKLSIACFLLRLADHRRHWRWVLYTIMGMTLPRVLSAALTYGWHSRPRPFHHWFGIIPYTSVSTCKRRLGFQFAAAAWVRFSQSRF